ncbi:MAG: hypothetical protein RLZZ262_1580, partial [Bacteroidota bacterium]
MFFRKLHILLILGLGLSLKAQAIETLKFDKKLQWIRGENTFSATFSGAYLDAENFDMPTILWETSKKGNYRTADYRIVRMLLEPVSAQEERLLLKYKPRYNPEVRCSETNKITIVQFKLAAYQFADGRWQRVQEIEVEVDIEPGLQARNRTLTFAEESALAFGEWYKIAIAKDGIYKVDKGLLTQLGVQDPNPQRINIYGNGGNLLPADNSLPRPDDLRKCAIGFNGNGDTIMTSDEYFLFYGEGPDTWALGTDATVSKTVWQHTKHFYTDSAYYFIRVDDSQPLRISNQTTIDAPADHVVTTFQDYQFHELDLYNLVASGREFYGDEFGSNVNSSFSFNFPNIVTTKDAVIQTRAAIRSVDLSSTFTYAVGNNSVTTEPAFHGDAATSPKAVTRVASMVITPVNSTINVGVTYNKGYADAQGWLDYIRINATRLLNMTGSQMIFRDSTWSGSNAIAQYQLTGAQNVWQIWDITDVSLPQKVNITSSGTINEWKGYKDLTREYIAFANGGFLTPTAFGSVENQNLHGLTDIDYLIIAAPNHMTAAEGLAEIHIAEGLNVALVSQQQIFNEFSSGNPDVTAIRMLVKMLYDRANGDENLRPKNVCLFGDGNYARNKGWNAFLENNVIVFESDRSEAPLSSYVSDDYFVFLSDDDDQSPDNFSDCGIGRIPAASTSQGLDYLAKVQAYLSEQTNGSTDASCIGDAAQSSYGPWRNKLIFVADDQDGSSGPSEFYHTTQSNLLAEATALNHPEYDLIKIFMDAYQQESTPGGERYEAVEDEIRNRIEAGALIVTYIGHGGEKGWAHERILNIETINNFTNKYRLPLFLTATCELAKFDDNSLVTAGEELIMNPNGGCIAEMTTTRIVFVSDNNELSSAFYNYALEDEDAELTFGKINMLTKNGVPASND